MKVKSLLCSLLVLLPLGLPAKEVKKVDLKSIKHPVQPMLWKIEGKGFKKPSYLFGTVHISDPRATNLHPLAQQAFDQADAVYTEIDLSMQNQMAVVPLLMSKDKKSLNERIGADMAMALNKELKAINPALNSAPFQRMHIWAVAMMLPQFEAQLTGKKALDVLLWDRAAAAEKKTAALETVQQQLGKFNELTLAEQKEFLDVTLKTLSRAREKGQKPYQEIIDAYLMADIAKLEKEMKKDTYLGIKMNPEVHQKFMRLILDERNVVMANTIKKALAKPKSGSCFFAAGALHYIGDQSVNNLLTKAGYKVTLVSQK